MQPDGDTANLGEAEHTTVQDSGTTVLGIGEAVVVTLSLEARIPRRLPILDAAEERLIRSLRPKHHILQDLGIDLSVFGARRFQVRQFSLLLIVAGTDALPASSPGFALFQGTVIERATAMQDRFQRLFLFGRWHQLVLVVLRTCATLCSSISLYSV
jgi:hypothetical protein